jgi:hypothetical protein
MIFGRFVKKIFDNVSEKYFDLYNYSNRYYLYDRDIKIGELIDGENGLEKYYKNDFQKWINKIRKRDLKRIDKIDSIMIDLIKEKKILKNRWGMK